MKLLLICLGIITVFCNTVSAYSVDIMTSYCVGYCLASGSPLPALVQSYTVLEAPTEIKSSDVPLIGILPDGEPCIIGWPEGIPMPSIQAFMATSIPQELAHYAYIPFLKYSVADGVYLDEEAYQLSITPVKPPDLITSENQFIALCDATFTNNANQKRSIVEFTAQAEAMKAAAMVVLATDPTQGLLDMMAASELIHRATGALMDVKNQAARWKGCPYDTNAAWDYIEYHPIGE